jgi:multidrug efflux pump subunit AcrA (membrane-fusion protein)
MSRPADHLVPEAEEPDRLPPPDNRRRHPARPAHPSHRALWLVLAGILILLTAVILAGYLPRHRRVAAAEEAARSERESLPVVNAVRVRRSSPVSELLLPGNITALVEASIYARASGYLRVRYVDIGDRVRHGQLMAEIEAPELDQQVQQARATAAQAQQQVGQTRAELEQVQANLELQRLTWSRYSILVARGAISRTRTSSRLASGHPKPTCIRPRPSCARHRRMRRRPAPTWNG